MHGSIPEETGNPRDDGAVGGVSDPDTATAPAEHPAGPVNAGGGDRESARIPDQGCRKLGYQLFRVIVQIG